MSYDIAEWQAEIPKTIRLSQFKVRPEDRCILRGVRPDDPSHYQTFRLMDFQGASFVVDVREGRDRDGSPQFHVRVRISEIRHDIVATARKDIVGSALKVIEPRRDIDSLSIAEIKQILRDRGESASIRGKTRKEDLQAALRSSEERRVEAATSKLAAKAGDQGIVVEMSQGNNGGSDDMTVAFNHCDLGRSRVRGVTREDVDLGGPRPSTGQALIHNGAKYYFEGGSIAFRRGVAGKPEEYFVGSHSKLACPGVIAPWCKAFKVKGEDSVFTKAGEGEIEVQAKLELSFENPLLDEEDEVETPKSKRSRTDPC